MRGCTEICKQEFRIIRVHLYSQLVGQQNSAGNHKSIHFVPIGVNNIAERNYNKRELQAEGPHVREACSQYPT